MARNKYPEETVQKILDVSLKLFIEKGYEETTILDIVNNLGGLSRGAFYHHFKSKEEVLNALGNKMFLNNNPFDMVKKEKQLNGLEKIKKVIKIQYYDKEQLKVNYLSILLLKNPKILSDHIKTTYEQIAPQFEELFDQAIKDGSIKMIKYPKSFVSLFSIIAQIWFVPTIFPCTEDEMIERLYFTKDMLDTLGVYIIDDEILELIKMSIKEVMKINEIA